MFKDYYHKNVKAVTKDGKVFIGFFSDASSAQDNEGPATIVIGRWELDEDEIEKMELIEEKDKDTQK